MLSWKLFSNSLTLKSQEFSSCYNIVRRLKIILKCKFWKASLSFTCSLQVFLFVSNNNNNQGLSAQCIVNNKSEHFTWYPSCYLHNRFHKVVFLLLFTDRKQAVEEMTYPSSYQVVSHWVVWTPKSCRSRWLITIAFCL